MEIFIPGNVPALKNGKIWTGTLLISSKGVQDYLRQHGIKNYSASKKQVEYYKTFKGVKFSEYCTIIKKELEMFTAPYKFAFHFIRKSKHRFDFGNAVELLADLFTAHGLIEDDNMNYFHPSIFYNNTQFGFTYNKNNPGVIIKIKND